MKGNFLILCFYCFVDSTGKETKRGHSAERHVSSPVIAEALALRSALNQALEDGIPNLLVLSDAHDLIRAINSQEQIKSIFGILFDIHALASLFDSISFSFILRSENVITDSIAKFAKSRLIDLSSQLGPSVVFET
ncbi:unnamed protein product [Microthlaspi erraticum]|uniref:RNase H type-1 domain-containing protein n=1 Tax=Microthlaspi erraticum TaxID=1685480 RepID=A0A6D2JSE8_9BRAS|nr:unnamed protein product [Microthlaspi erraticum]